MIFKSCNYFFFLRIGTTHFEAYCLVKHSSELPWRRFNYRIFFTKVFRTFDMQVLLTFERPILYYNIIFSLSHSFLISFTALKHSPSKKKLAARTRATSVGDGAGLAEPISASQESGNYVIFLPSQTNV